MQTVVDQTLEYSVLNGMTSANLRAQGVSQKRREAKGWGWGFMGDVETEETLFLCFYRECV